ncbi:hypothetical protein PV325_001374 [Microctonus aethiopoides]|nr:hypothetical protein PV325_001374 [Microctonus aethiopoides]
MFVVGVICPIKPRGSIPISAKDGEQDDTHAAESDAKPTRSFHLCSRHESRILTPGGGAVSPGGTGPPASPPAGHYHSTSHSPPLIKLVDNDKKHMQALSLAESTALKL